MHFNTFNYIDAYIWKDSFFRDFAYIVDIKLFAEYFTAPIIISPHVIDSSFRVIEIIIDHFLYYWRFELSNYILHSYLCETF